MTAIGFHECRHRAAGAHPRRRPRAAAALLAMAVFHFVYDLELFGWVAPGTSVTGGWRVLAL
jgi:hypothetical protein